MRPFEAFDLHDVDGFCRGHLRPREILIGYRFFGGLVRSERFEGETVLGLREAEGLFADGAQVVSGVEAPFPSEIPKFDVFEQPQFVYGVWAGSEDREVWDGDVFVEVGGLGFLFLDLETFLLFSLFRFEAELLLMSLSSGVLFSGSSFIVGYLLGLEAFFDGIPGFPYGG